MKRKSVLPVVGLIALALMLAVRQTRRGAILSGQRRNL
jgi:hypothetical protein